MTLLFKLIKMAGKMSQIMKSMAETLLGHPERIPSSEAAHAALLFASVGWNRANGSAEGLIP